MSFVSLLFKIGVFMEKTVRCLLVDELRTLLSLEHQVVRALPHMVEAAECQGLKKAFNSHFKETKKQVRRLEKIFRLMNIQKKPRFCKAAKGLVQECNQVLREIRKKSALKDAALISKAQRIEHYEISAYGTARAFAKELGLYRVAELLQETLDEESRADSKLTRIAKGWVINTGVNHQAHIEGDNGSDAEDKSNFFKMMRRFQKARKAA